MRAFLYLRVSTATQADSGLGAEMQEAACRQLCALRGWPVAGVFRDEGVPGTTAPAKRKGLMALTAAWRATEGEKTVVAYDLKRLARRSRIALELLDPAGPWKLNLTSATQAIDTTTPMGRAMITVLAAFAELDWEEIRERNRAMQATAKRRGSRWGAAKMFERTEKDPMTGKVRYLVDPDLVERVRMVQDRYRSGDYSIASLARWLNERKIPSVKGKRWHSKTVWAAVNEELPVEGR